MKHPFVLATLLLASVVHAEPPKGPIADLGFLVGRWGAGEGVVADTGGKAKGTSTFTAEANGTALLRRDHTDLFDQAGKPVGDFDQLMLIYPEDGTLHAEYSDGEHLIHYREAQVVAGRSVTFLSAGPPGAPVFRLVYELTDPGVLDIAFAMAPPGQATFRPIANGTVKRLP